MNKRIYRTARKCIIAIALFMVVLILISCLTGCASITGRYHAWRTDVMQAADLNRYETRKQVEDTCRASIVSYESDKMTWLQYKDSDSEEQRSWADAAKMRANKAAITYNEYFRKNSFVFDGNVPDDIDEELPLLE